MWLVGGCSGLLSTGSIFMVGTDVPLVVGNDFLVDRAPCRVCVRWPFDVFRPRKGNTLRHYCR